MSNYLKGYLASIPRSEYDSMVSFLKDNIIDKLNTGSEDKKKQFELLLDQITADRQPATQHREIHSSEKPSDTYNDFFSNVYIDMSYLYKIINLLYNAIDGYSSLSSSYLTDIKSEIDKLEGMIKELKAKEEYSSNAIIVTETFNNSEYFESYNSSTSNLFCDRGGQPLKAVDLAHNNTNDMIILNVLKDVDLLHGSDGKPLAKLDVIDYRGVPIDTYSVTSNAIDNSNLSFWDCSVLSTEPIDVALDNYEAGGAYIKFRVRLPALCEITEVSITPYCIYPVEICDILIGDQSILNTPESSTDTITARSAKVVSDEITIIMRQKNYTHMTEVTNKKVDEANELWNRTLNKARETYVSRKTITNDVEIYNHYVADKEKDITTWNEDFIKSREIGG